MFVKLYFNFTVGNNTILKIFSICAQQFINLLKRMEQADENLFDTALKVYLLQYQRFIIRAMDIFIRNFRGYEISNS